MFGWYSTVLLGLLLSLFLLISCSWLSAWGEGDLIDALAGGVGLGGGINASCGPGYIGAFGSVRIVVLFCSLLYDTGGIQKPPCLDEEAIRKSKAIRWCSSTCVGCFG